MRYATILLAANLGGLVGMVAPWFLLLSLAPWLGQAGYLMLLPGLVGSLTGCICGVLCAVRLGIGWAKTGGGVARGLGVIMLAVFVGAAVGSLIPLAVLVAIRATAP